VSWLPVGSRGWNPTTVNAGVALGEEDVALGEDTVLPAVGAAADGPAEHPDSAATTHRDEAEIIHSLVGI
jgi:hypothetical protein